MINEKPTIRDMFAVNYGSSIVGYIPTINRIPQIAEELNYIRRYTKNVRISMTDWNYPTPMIQYLKDVAVVAKSAGFHVTWGITSTNTRLTVANWPAFQAAVIEAGRWAQANNIDEFMVCNEMDVSTKYQAPITGTEQRTRIKNLCDAVKLPVVDGGSGYAGKTSIAISQDTIRDWYNEGGFGNFDTIGLNAYLPNRKMYIDQLVEFAKNAGDKGFLAEWHIVDTWPQLNPLSEEWIAQMAAQRAEDILAAGIKRAHFFSYSAIRYENLHLGDHSWSALESTGRFRPTWPAVTGGRRRSTV